MLRPWVLAAAAAVCAVTAAAIPRAAFADEIFVVEQSSMLESLQVQIDGTRIVVHATNGYTIGGWGQRDEEQVFIDLESGGSGGRITAVIEAGTGPDEITVVDGGTVVWEVVRGATITLRGFRAGADVLVSVLEAVEVR